MASFADMPDGRHKLRVERIQVLAAQVVDALFLSGHVAQNGFREAVRAVIFLVRGNQMRHGLTWYVFVNFS